jgi:hypothetical protein
MYKGVETLAPEDVAEVIVFAASRRENVVIADVLLYPHHQVRDDLFFILWFSSIAATLLRKMVFQRSYVDD